MEETTKKLPAQSEDAAPVATGPMFWRPFESLRREVDRLFSDFDRDMWGPAFLRSALRGADPFRHSWGTVARGAPPVDVVERDDAYEVSVELPGFDEKNIDVRAADGRLTVRAEKEEQKDEKKGEYHLRERQFGAVERILPLPEGGDPDKISALFRKGVLTITVPKKPGVRKEAQRIEVKAG